MAALYTIPHLDITSLPPDRVLLCCNQAKSIIWLELSGTTYITTGLVKSDQGVTVHIGAKPHLGRWALVDAGTVAANRELKMRIDVGDSAKLAYFQRKIIEDWARFDGNSAGAWAKGTTFGKSFTSASFVMKALKTGFDAIGEPTPAYSGVRVKDFQVDDLIAYLGKRLSKPIGAGWSAFAAPGRTVLYRDFRPLPPKPLGTHENPPMDRDTRAIPVILSSKPHGGKFAYADEAFTSLQTGATGKVPFERVIGYGFRGDSRDPDAIRDAGGFTPNFTRPAHIEKAKVTSLPDDQALNLAKFLGNQEYGGYVSTSKSYAVAKHFVRMNGGGWTYVCFVEGGFHVPPMGPQKGVLVPFDEQELAMPGMFDWQDVVACREVTSGGMFTGDVFVRPSLRTEESPAVFNKIWDLLSGESQG